MRKREEHLRTRESEVHAMQLQVEGREKLIQKWESIASGKHHLRMHRFLKAVHVSTTYSHTYTLFVQLEVDSLEERESEHQSR